ncbi:Proteinaceous RNase P 1, chloroplastic/mitochondrial [Vitis vinifera]|uniref:ribonuclease P n=1 Tax=Vitis vinifera TaxID=29760 RepID=A0A438BXI1_VITVI|nr:Proteinaceous RNase P 1, chloroplastic/mitochondrial [Vitis vinifera]RVX02507.1 Proteinaceous RNase P 1, chloroplastic/mitochondrial [Vitis vinifera]
MTLLYWLYAAVNCNCLLVTNDEMRDHLFQLLGTSFFPRWKEKHQHSGILLEPHCMTLIPPSLLMFHNSVFLPLDAAYEENQINPITLLLREISVRLTITRRGPVLHMPPPYSIVIQESEQGSWHVPTVTGDDLETPRQWLCATRTRKNHRHPQHLE